MKTRCSQGVPTAGVSICHFEEVAATWVGVEAVNPVAATIDRLFGFTKYENLSHTSGNILTSLTSFTSPEAGGSLGAWDAIYNINTGLPLFGHAEAMADVPTVTMTDASVMNPAVFLGSANLDYIANSDPALTPQSTDALNLTEADYNQWTVTNGVFTVVACPATADFCAAPSVNEDGLYQRVVVVDGVQYYQTILVADGTTTGVAAVQYKDKLVETSPGVWEVEQKETFPGSGIWVNVQVVDNFAPTALAFKNETFIKADDGASGSGIASRMHLAERGTDTAYLGAATSVDMPGSAGDFTTDVAMNTGWANRGSVFVARDMDGNGIIDTGEGITEPHATIAIEQGLYVEDNIQTDAVSMADLFTLERGATPADRRMTISNRTGTQIGFVNPIKFNSVTVSGAYQRTARADIADPFMLPGNSSDLTWSAGDALQATWLAAQYGTNPLVSVSEFGTTSFVNRTTGERITYTDVDTLPVSPDNWLIDPFLAEPSYP